MFDAIFLQFLNGLDKGGAYALIALGLTLVFGTLGVAAAVFFAILGHLSETTVTIFGTQYEFDIKGVPNRVESPGEQHTEERVP